MLDIREATELAAIVEEWERRQEEARARIEMERVRVQGDAIRAKCRTLHGFIEEFWYVLEPVTPFRTGWALQAMCAHLEAVHRGQIQNLLMTVPPGCMKSLMVSVFLQAWEWGPMEMAWLRYLATSFSDSNVTRDSDKVRRLVMSEKYQALWGDSVKPAQKWGTYKFENTAGGNRDCRPFASLTGGRGDRVLIDDPHSTSSAESDAEREKTVKDYREGATDRLNDVTKSATIIIMQRLHQADVAGTILNLGLNFTHLNLPMEFEPAQRCVTPVFTDPRTTPGELLFPERFPADYLARMRLAKGDYAYSGQYQQRPVPREGGLFKAHMLKVEAAAPARMIRYVRAWDLAASVQRGSDDPDWTVGVLIARDTQGFFWILDVIRVRYPSEQVEALIKHTADKDRARFGNVKVRGPQDPGQAGKSQAAALTRLLAGHPVEFLPISGRKEVRATPFAAQVNAGNVRMLEGPWNDVFTEELGLFPGATHDDQVDAGSDAFNDVAANGGADGWLQSYRERYEARHRDEFDDEEELADA